MTYLHPEAYCLMKYRSDDGTEEELIWNSRDGVTPFIITLRSGKSAEHVEWRHDVRVQGFRPPLGMRIFVDITEERARELAQERAAYYWDHPEYPARERYPSREAFEDMLFRDYFQPGAPDLIEVTR